jgi:hypothetical protein
MTTKPELFEAASDAEGLARSLNQANILSIWDAPGASDECLQNAVGYLRRVADRMGFAVTEKAPPVEPVRTAESIYTGWEYAESRGQL